MCLDPSRTFGLVSVQRIKTRRTSASLTYSRRRRRCGSFHWSPSSDPLIFRAIYGHPETRESLRHETIRQHRVSIGASPAERAAGHPSGRGGGEELGWGGGG